MVRVGVVAGLASWQAQASGVPGNDLSEVVISATRTNDLAGDATSASEGTVPGFQLEVRPLLRTGEVLEVVPGLIVTQHSGDGKANQYFLRGFNLDHGTDLATSVEGLPVNMPTHAHGQGYSDLNFMIPELISEIQYRKGTYYAEEGNFSAAGSVDISYRRALPDTLLQTTAGADDYTRTVLAGSTALAGGDLLVGLDTTYENGPWDLPEHLLKQNGVLKFTQGDHELGYSLEGMAYDGHWRSSDQIPLRAVQSGLIDRFGNIDPTDGGETYRYSLSANGWMPLGPGRLTALVYGIDYQLNLYSDFTYFTDPVHGDQFEQYDKRQIAGADVRYAQPLAQFDRDGTLSAGVQLRHDDIAPVGLYLTENQARYDTVSQDDVKQTSYSAFLSDSVHWTPVFRTELGARVDRFDFVVHSNLAANSGQLSDSIVSPKATVTLGPWNKTEFFLDWGQGFHSNDARGATLTVDPGNGMTPVERVTPLVRAVGEEVGLRSAAIPHWQLSGSLWTLKLDSELVFSGDGGTTEPSRASRRTGVELSAYYSPIPELIIDGDFAATRARFIQYDPAGDRIPNAVEQVVSVGLAYNPATRWFTGIRLRYLGAAPLVENNSVRSAPAALVNLNVGYHFTRPVSASLAVLNALNHPTNDITYYYASQLRGESAPVDDIHFHPAEPREVRMTLTARL